MHIHVHAHRGQRLMLGSSAVAHSIFWDSLLLNPDLADSTRWTGRQAPGIFLFLSPHCCDYSCAPLHPASLHGGWGSNSGLYVCVARTLQEHRLPKPPFFPFHSIKTPSLWDGTLSGWVFLSQLILLWNHPSEIPRVHRWVTIMMHVCIHAYFLSVIQLTNLYIVENNLTMGWNHRRHSCKAKLVLFHLSEVW